MTTETKTKPTDSVDSCWPPKAHLVRAEDLPAKEGDYAICGAKLMGLALTDAKNVCKKCAEIAKREFI